MGDGHGSGPGSEAGDGGPVIIVSGLPRSGTSMMMKMLEAGGLDVVVDGVRTADDDNPKGYYEYERVKKLPAGDTEWVGEAGGKVVKVISALLEFLPADEHYKVVFMQRRLIEVLRSQQKMLANRDEAADAVADEQLKSYFTKHLASVEEWLQGRSNVEVVFVDYNAMLVDPEPAVAQVSDLLDLDLDTGLDTAAMSQVVDPNLYRNRG